MSAPTTNTGADIDPNRDATKQKNEDNDAPILKKFEDLYALIDSIQVAMMTTRRQDGALVSRAMQSRRRTSAADIYFIANNKTHKFDELTFDPHVNLAYYRESTGEWISISGVARVDNDPEVIKSLWMPDCKAWFGDLGDGVHDGGPMDPRISVIFVEAQSVMYSKKDTPSIVQMYNIVKGMVTGEPPKVSVERVLQDNELNLARSTLAQ